MTYYDIRAVRRKARDRVELVENSLNFIVSYAEMGQLT